MVTNPKIIVYSDSNDSVNKLSHMLDFFYAEKRVMGANSNEAQSDAHLQVRLTTADLIKSLNSKQSIADAYVYATEPEGKTKKDVVYEFSGHFLLDFGKSFLGPPVHEGRPFGAYLTALGAELAGKISGMANSGIANLSSGDVGRKKDSLKKLGAWQDFTKLVHFIAGKNNQPVEEVFNSMGIVGPASENNRMGYGTFKKQQQCFTSEQRAEFRKSGELLSANKALTPVQLEITEVCEGLLSSRANMEILKAALLGP